MITKLKNRAPVRITGGPFEGEAGRIEARGLVAEQVAEEGEIVVRLKDGRVAIVPDTGVREETDAVRTLDRSTDRTLEDKHEAGKNNS